jgi:hypothetical protein
MTTRPADPWPRGPALLALPLLVLVLIAWLEWQPFAGLLRAVTSHPDGGPTALGLLLVLGSIAGFLAAIVVSAAEVLRAHRAGRGWTARLYHLALAVGLLLVVLAAIGGLVVDQYPCWQGVPNCD